MARSQHYNNNDRPDVLPIHEDSQLEIEVAYRAWNYHRTITFLAGIDLVFLLLYVRCSFCFHHFILFSFLCFV